MKVNIDTSDMLYAEAWHGFKGTDWKEEINVRDFIQHNYTPYTADGVGPLASGDELEVGFNGLTLSTRVL